MKINELRDAANRTNPYNSIRISALIRQLLIDGTPLIHIANRDPKLKIRFTVDAAGDSALELPPDVSRRIDSETNIFRIALAEDSDPAIVDIDTFLSLPCAESNGEDVTVREITKFIANKGGGVHSTYDPLESQDSKCADLLSTYRMVGVSTSALLMRQIAYVVLDGVKELYDALLPFPGQLPLVLAFSFSYPATGHQVTLPHAAIFESNQHMNVIKNDHVYTAGFEFHFVMRMPMIHSSIENGLLYEAGDESGPKFQVFHTGKHRIARFFLNCDLTLSTRVPDQPGHYRNFHMYSVRVIREDDFFRCESILQGRIYPGSAAKAETDVIKFDYQTLGADKDGSGGAEFELRELFVSEPLKSEEFVVLQHYFQKKLWPNN